MNTILLKKKVPGEVFPADVTVWACSQISVRNILEGVHFAVTFG